MKSSGLFIPPLNLLLQHCSSFTCLSATKLCLPYQSNLNVGVSNVTSFPKIEKVIENQSEAEYKNEDEYFEHLLWKLANVCSIYHILNGR